MVDFERELCALRSRLHAGDTSAVDEFADSFVPHIARIVRRAAARNTSHPVLKRMISQARRDLDSSGPSPLNEGVVSLVVARVAERLLGVDFSSHPAAEGVVRNAALKRVKNSPQQQQDLLQTQHCGSYLQDTQPATAITRGSLAWTLAEKISEFLSESARVSLRESQSQ